jgi:hypothetical protein
MGEQNPETMHYQIHHHEHMKKQAENSPTDIQEPPDGFILLYGLQKKQCTKQRSKKQRSVHPRLLAVPNMERRNRHRKQGA